MKPIVLVAHDEPITRSMYRLVLERNGFKVNHANDGVDTLLQVELVNPDVVIVDVQMPQLNGIDVCRKLREQPETADLPIILCDTKPSSASPVKVAPAKASKFLGKHFSSKRLLNVVRELLGLQPDMRKAWI